jgi:voltage-gated potassium channel
VSDRNHHIIDALDGRPNPYGMRLFYGLNVLIVISALLIGLESEPALRQTYGAWMRIAEFFVLMLFVAEYAARLILNPNRWRYAFSFWGIIDFAACIPALLFLFPDLQTLRVLRLLRLLRLMKLLRMRRALERLEIAMKSSRDELALFVFLALLILYLSAVGIYHFENAAQPDKFGSIFQSLWWAISSLTTVGYGDVYPITSAGRLFAGGVLILGLGIVAVPAAIVTSALLSADKEIRKSSFDQQGDHK